MKIRKITLENFRTFYGKHSIDFSNNEDKPVTIFIGENGSGKTTILNAIYWGFTGGTTKQFSESDVLINKDAELEKGSKCVVEIHFEANDINYVLTRATNKKAGVSSVTMGYYDSSKSYVPVKETQIKNIIEKLIPSKLANWYIFDGEAIGHLHLSGDSKFKEELQRTFGFDGLKTLNLIVNELKADYAREQRKQIGNDELDKIGNEIEQCEKDIDSYNQIIETQRRTEENTKKQIDSIESELLKFKPAAPLQSRRSNAERIIKESKTILKSKIASRNELLIRNTPHLLLSIELEKLTNKLHEKEINQTLPEPFGTGLIDDIQKAKQCICGNPIIHGTESYEKIESWRAKAATSQHVHRITLLRSQIASFISVGKNFNNQMNDLKSDIGQKESEIASQEQLIKQTEDEINSIPIEEIKNLQGKKSVLTNQLHSIIGDISKNIYLRDSKKSELRGLENRQQVMFDSHSRNNNLSKEKKKFEILSEYINLQYLRQEQEVLKGLNDEITGVLFKYLTKNYKAIVDSDTYAVKTFDIDSRPVTLSTGETNVLKFAVIAAIVGMAASRTKISKVNWITEPIIAPLIFDAPFSVVDSEYRTGITNNLTELSSQLILLFDSDKWNTEMSNILKNKVGKFYAIISHAKGESKEINKFLKIDNLVINLNKYGSERDESKCIEINHE